MGGDGLFPTVVDVEAGVFPGEEIGKFGGADEFGVVESMEEAVAEEFDGGSEVFGGHAVEATVGGEESVGGKDVEVGVVDEEVVPTMVNDLPKGRGAGTAGLVDGRHKECL